MHTTNMLFFSVQKGEISNIFYMCNMYICTYTHTHIYACSWQNFGKDKSGINKKESRTGVERGVTLLWCVILIFEPVNIS